MLTTPDGLLLPLPSECARLFFLRRDPVVFRNPVSFQSASHYGRPFNFPPPSVPSLDRSSPVMSNVLSAF